MIVKMKTSIWDSKDKSEKVFPKHNKKNRKENYRTNLEGPIST